MEFLLSLWHPSGHGVVPRRLSHCNAVFENVHRESCFLVEKLDFGATLQTNIRDAFRGVRRNREVVQQELCDAELERAVSHEAEAELRRTNAEERATPEFRALVSERTRLAMADVGVRERLSAAQQSTSAARGGRKLNVGVYIP